MSHRSRAAAASAWTGIASVAMLAAGPAGTHLGLWPAIAGFLVFQAGSILGGLLTLVLALAGLRAVRSGLEGRAQARTGLLLGIALVAILGGTVVMLFSVPRIHDIATDTEDPPPLEQAAHLPGNRGRDLSYPNGDPATPGLTRQGYPDLQPLRLDASPDQAFQWAEDAAREMGWSITWSNRVLRRFEAYGQTAFFGFTFDVAVRVEGADAGSVVDARSLSRVGQSDFGDNAERIRAFFNHIRAIRDEGRPS